MKNTKEEIFEYFFSPRNRKTSEGISIMMAMEEFAIQATTHLTDQIKSMEGQVKELRDENEIQGNYNDMLIKELESLQKENERLYDALSNIMNNERWLEMNIDTVNNLLSKHA